MGGGHVSCPMRPRECVDVRGALEFRNHMLAAVGAMPHHGCARRPSCLLCLVCWCDVFDPPEHRQVAVARRISLAMSEQRPQRECRE